jgi:hypothetical protein
LSLHGYWDGPRRINGSQERYLKKKILESVGEIKGEEAENKGEKK